MSTAQTPALARATESLRVDGAHRRGIPVPHVAIWEQKEDARDAVSAALHDPGDPDWLARVHDEHRRISPAHMNTSLCSCGERFDTQWRWCQHVARAVRAAILGPSS